jgi:crotonobetainyl-CoA:carnitine CoA-transferase CaiB-like acyl-CoA transferase
LHFLNILTGATISRLTLVGSSIGDTIPGLFLALSVCAALHDRLLNGGVGTHIDTAMFDCMVTVLEHSWINYASMKEISGALETKLLSHCCRAVRFAFGKKCE